VVEDVEEIKVICSHFKDSICLTCVYVIISRSKKAAAEAECKACAKEPERMAEVIKGFKDDRHDGAFVALTRATKAILERHFK